MRKARYQLMRVLAVEFAIQKKSEGRLVIAHGTSTLLKSDTGESNIGLR
jgi:hypothetical protein